MKVIQAYRFALDPTLAQEHALRSHAGAARFAWNWGLAKVKERYEAEGTWYSATELHKLWNAEKKSDPALGWWDENSKVSRRVSGSAFRGSRDVVDAATRSGSPPNRCAAQELRSPSPGLARSARTNPPVSSPVA
jgi:hypothetical protein